MVSTSTISTSTIFIAIGIKPVLAEFSRIFYVVKFVLVEIAIYSQLVQISHSTFFPGPKNRTMRGPLYCARDRSPLDLLTIALTAAILRSREYRNN